MGLGPRDCDHAKWSPDGLLILIASHPGLGMLCPGCGTYVYPRRDVFGQWLFSRGIPRQDQMWVLKTTLDNTNFAGNAVMVRGEVRRDEGFSYWSSLWNQPLLPWLLIEDQYFDYRIL